MNRLRRSVRKPSAVLAAARRAAGGLPIRPPAFAGATLGRDEERAAAEALANPDRWTDPEPMAAFEEAFARWTRAPHAASFFGGRVALAAAIEALGLRAGDEVIVPAYTCVVVPTAFELAGVRVRFADIEGQTYGLSAQALQASLGPRTKAVLLHHLYGLVARDYAECVEAARAHGVAVIEDCAQASGALWRGRPVGGLGDVAIHSLEKTKVLTTVFGGVATTADDGLARRLRAIQAAAPWPSATATSRVLASIGPLRRAAAGGPAPAAAERWQSTTDDELRGFGPAEGRSRLPGPLAQIGLLQLRTVDGHNERRRRRAVRWSKWAQSEGFEPAHVVPGSTPVFLRYPVMAGPARKRDLSWGRRLGVKPGVWFLGTRHPVPGTEPGFPAAARAVEGCVNLPTLW